VAPEVIQMPEEYRQAHDTICHQLTDEILKTSDVIYDTRMQQERFEDQTQFREVRDSFIFTKENVSLMKPTGSLLHPLPRVNEISQSVDNLPQAKYFEQAQNGVPVRM